MSTEIFTAAELATAGTDTWALTQKLKVAAYTGIVVEHRAWEDDNYHVTVDGSPVRATLLNDMETVVIPSLSVDVPETVVLGNGVATADVVVTDSRGAGASGTAIKLQIPDRAFVPVNGDAFTLDGSGQATLTFGPLTGCTGRIQMMLCYADRCGADVAFGVRFGT